jgi:ADP-ribosylglycohydrolase
LDASVDTAVNRLGNGSYVVAADTVPFCVWSAARHLDNYAEALWQTVYGLGDRDTTCAIVGGIVALSADRRTVPDTWLRSREPLQVSYRDG